MMIRKAEKKRRGPMMNKVNYQKELDRVIAAIPEGSVPTLFLHSCCAPCSSYVLEYLSQFFEITVFYYNPNIFPRNKGQRTQTPSFVFFVVDLRITHRHQMPHTPGHHSVL